PAAQQPAPQQPAPQQTPAQAPTVPGPDEQQTQKAHIAEPPPPPPKVPDIRRPGETGYWVDVEAWFPKEQPKFDRARLSTFTGLSKATLPGKPRYGENFEAGLAVGLHNTLRFTLTDVKGTGTFTTGNDLVAWDQVYTSGTLMTANYHMQHARLSYEFLTWPYPVGSRKFRLKTLWQVQYTKVASAFDSPLAYYDSSGNLKLDSATGQ